MRIAFVFGSIPTRNDKETDIRKAVIEKKDWLGQEAQTVRKVLEARRKEGEPAPAVSVHLMYPLEAHVAATDAETQGVEWFATRPRFPMTRRWFYQGKQWSNRFMRKIIDWRPDLVHWQMNSYAYTFHLAGRKLIKAGIPYVYQHHGPHLAKKPWVRQVLKYPNRQALRGIYLTKYHEQQYREGLGLDPKLSRIIRVGYDERFRPLDKAKCKAETGLTGDPILFWAAGITVRKDPITLLKAFERVAEEFPEARLYMAGYGPLDAQVKAMAAGSAILTRQVRLMGYVPNVQLPAYENAADIFVMASRGEGFALSSMEAMACGCFPVLTTLPCFVEQTDGGRLAQLFEPGDVEGCVKALRKAIGDVSYRERVRKELPAAVAKLTWDHVCEELVDLYEEVLDEIDQRGKAT